MEENAQLVYSTRTEQSRKIRSYDRNKLYDFIAVNNNLLMYYFKLNEEEWSVLGDNLTEIVDYIAASRDIHKTDQFRVGRIMRIAYSEYADFLTSVISASKWDKEKGIEADIKRAMHPMVRKFKPECKEQILTKYLKIYEEYEQTFKML